MPNEKKPENPSDALRVETPQESQQDWFVYGIVHNLLPRLKEIEDIGTLMVFSKSTMELIENVFNNKNKIDLRELSQDQLIAIANAMPQILEDLDRLGYPLLKAELFECGKAFTLRVEKLVEERASESRGKVAEVLGD